jgi:protein-tyrosine phosphatase
MHKRRLLIDKVNNMRELGGYATLDGKITLWNRFIRSNLPADLSETDIRFLYDYGVRTVIDLRHPEEAGVQPTAFIGAKGFHFQNISFTDDFRLLGDTQYCPLHHLVPVVKGPNRIAEVLRAFLNTEGAVLFYCFAGKDRTGVFAVLLLMLARVPIEDVIADYQVTYTYIRNFINRRDHVSDVGKRPLFLLELDKDKPPRPEHLRRTEPEWIQPFIDYILEFGGVEGYMAHIGLTMDEIKRLRDRLLLP